MGKKPAWPATLVRTEPEQLQLPLPPRPGIKRGCPKCLCVHGSREETMACLADRGK